MELMATKTWKIGEYAKGGIITVEIKGNKIAVIGKDWDTSKGYNRGSNQSSAKEFDRFEIDAKERESHNKLYMYLSDLTTHYYASNILEWIETKVDLTFRF